jgi:hypothetical protein
MNNTSMIKELVPVLAALAGGLLTFLGVAFQQARARTTDRRKLLREKIEEIYVLSNQLDDWVLYQMHDMTRLQTGIGTDDPKEQEPSNPMPRLLMLTKIYAPKLSTAASDLDKTANSIRKAAFDFCLKFAQAQGPLAQEEFAAAVVPVDDAQKSSAHFRQLIEKYVQDYI